MPGICRWIACVHLCSASGHPVTFLNHLRFTRFALVYLRADGRAGIPFTPIRWGPTLVHHLRFAHLVSACSSFAHLCSVTQLSAQPGLHVDALFDQSTVGGGVSSYQHLTGGELLWYTTCALHVLLALRPLAVIKVLGYLPLAPDDKTCRLVDAVVGGGLYASA